MTLFSGIPGGCFTHRDSLHLRVANLCGCLAHRDSTHLCVALFSGIPFRCLAHHYGIHLCGLSSVALLVVAGSTVTVFDDA